LHDTAQYPGQTVAGLTVGKSIPEIAGNVNTRAEAAAWRGVPLVERLPKKAGIYT